MSNGMQASDHEESIRARAYQLWESEGRPEGKHFEHWQRSEQETGREASLLAASEKRPSPARRAKSKSKKAIAN